VANADGCSDLDWRKEDRVTDIHHIETLPGRALGLCIWAAYFILGIYIGSTT
jgi:hypothetical protein